MNGFFLHFVRGFLSALKSRQALVVENWSLRHELLAAQQSLLRVGLERARCTVRETATGPGAVGGDWVSRWRYSRAASWFGVEESRICTALIFVAILLLAANGFRSFRTFVPGGNTADVWAELDSFSQPAVAEAVLRREAQALLIEYGDGYNAYLQALDLWKRAYAAWAKDMTADVASRSLTLFESTHGAMPTFALDKWVQRFNRCRASLSNQSMAEGLEHSLLLLYEQNGRWSEFLDLYLDIVRKSPANSDVVDWAQKALTRSRIYGREDEVLAYLQFVAKFGRPPSLARLTPILQRWNGTRQKPGSPLALYFGTELERFC